jgi:hypothetical protein
MEALVVAIAALVVFVLIDAGHWIVVSLVRWSSVIIAGAVAGWVAGRQGLPPMEALAVGALTSLIARFTMRELQGRTHGDDS